MTKRLSAFDRFMTFLVGALLIALAVGAAGWWSNTLFTRDRSIPLSGLDGTATEAWFPWAVGAGAVVAIVLALRWLAAHAYHRVDSRLRYADAAKPASVFVELDGVVSAAEGAFERLLDVRSAKGRVVKEQGMRFLDFEIKVDPHCDLHRFTLDAERVLSDLDQCLEGKFEARVVLDGVSRGTRMSRVS